MNDRDRYGRDYGIGPRGPDPDLPIRGRGDWYAYDWPGTYDRADTGELEGGRYRAPSNAYRAAGRKGPKNYQRSDERVREDICERLWHSSYVDSSEVEVTVQNGEVTLEGTVPERNMKHAIEDMADNCLGVKDVHNRIRVSRTDLERKAEDSDRSWIERGASGFSSVKPDKP